MDSFIKTMKNFNLISFFSVGFLLFSILSQAAVLKSRDSIEGEHRSNASTVVEHSITSAAKGSPGQSFVILDAVLEATKLNATLDNLESFTLLAPTDKAFLDLFTQEELDELLADDADKDDDLNALTTLLMHHVVENKIMSNGLIDGLTLTVSDLIGNDVDIFLYSGVITVSNARVVEADILTSNGAMHVVDAVLVL